MAALDVSHVAALSNKALLLSKQGRYACAAEHYARATAAAQALGAHEDCLIVASLRVAHADVLKCCACCDDMATPALSATMLRDAFTVLLPAAVMALQRRKAARTLLAGTCRAHEEAWHCAHVAQSAQIFGLPPGLAQSWHEMARFVGYDAYLTAAKLGFDCVQTSYTQSVLTAANARLYLLLTCDALDAMAQPRDSKHQWCSPEVALVEVLKPAIEGGRIPRSGPAAQLHEAWERLQASGVLRERHIDHGLVVTRQVLLPRVAAAADAVAARGLHVCALASCARQEERVLQFKRCGACRAAVYCCKEHQVADWSQHKKACKIKGVRALLQWRSSKRRSAEGS
jgi:hypothetical protein